MIAGGVVLIVLGLFFAVGGYRLSSSDWAWAHRNSPWRRGVNVSENRPTHTWLRPSGRHPQRTLAAAVGG